MKILKNNKDTRKSEYASYGTEGHTNVFTGEFQKPTIIDWSRGGKTLASAGGPGDTNTFSSTTSEIKGKLSELLPDNIPTGILTNEDIVNAHMIHRFSEAEFLPQHELKYLPTKAILKLLEHFDIDYESSL